MFPNLNAEQARYGKTNEDMAAFLNMSRVTYEKKKVDGTFSIADANSLCDFFRCEYQYLFQETPLVPIVWQPVKDEPTVE